MATILSGSPDFRWSAVRGKRAPNERLELAARQISAADMFAAACADALSVAPPMIAAPRQAIWQLRVKVIAKVPQRAWYRSRLVRRPAYIQRHRVLKASQ